MRRELNMSGVNAAQLSVIALIITAAIAWFACTASVPPSVTCQGIRSLTVGMSPQQVEAAIGKPTHQTAVSPGEMTPFGSELTWTYERDGSLGGLRFGVEFNKGALKNVSAYVRYVWEDRPATTHLYWLSAGEKDERPLFEKYFPCRH